MMRIASARLTLRPLTPDDCTDSYVAWLNDPEVNAFLETRHAPQTLTSVRDFVETINARPNEHLFGIFLSDGDRHIGNIKVGPIDPRHSVADVSLLLGARECWGQGYGSEAILALSRYAIEELGLCKLSASMYALNEGSVRAFLKAGYRREGLRRAHYLLDGEPCDIVELGLTAGDPT